MQKGKTREVRNSLLFLEGSSEPLIVYPVGKHIGIRNLANNSMQFIRQPEQVREITGLTISTGGLRRYLAACELRQHDSNVYVSVYDVKNVNALKPPKTINVTELLQ